MNRMANLKQNSNGQTTLAVGNLTAGYRRVYRYLRQDIGFNRHDANLVMLGVALTSDAAAGMPAQLTPQLD